MSAPGAAPPAASVPDGNLLRWAGGIVGVKRTAAGPTGISSRFRMFARAGDRLVLCGHRV